MSRAPIAIVDIGTRHHLTGRAAVIVALVCVYAKRINAMRAGRVEVHLAPSGKVETHLHECMEPIEIEGGIEEWPK